ncbi:MAG: dephospho-CoA kinase [Anaerolineaceae bacterium]|nr:dephospho-CoA kinase [Anaerolineaceae bacterium]
MSKWADKFVIGLTGNIGTGKSVVRKMLELLGAYGIDADALAHRAMAQGAPGYLPIVQTFGEWILKPDREIDRAKLGRVVFNDPEALRCLEAILHPLVGQAIDMLVKRARQKVVVIEAIKLLEAGMGQWCDSLWVTYAPEVVQMERLVKRRNMQENEARQRIAAQPPQEEKMAAAQVLIRNDASFVETWKQVSDNWRQVVGYRSIEPATWVAEVKKPIGEITVLRGKPQHSTEIAEKMNLYGKPGAPRLSSDDIMAAFGEKAFLLIQIGSQLVGLIGWQVENLVVRTFDLIIDPFVPPDQALPVLVNEMEKASRELQCEASLVFLSEEGRHLEPIWKKLGYEARLPKDLGVQAWQEAAQESLKPGMKLYFKQLRIDRVLRPI